MVMTPTGTTPSAIGRWIDGRLGRDADLVRSTLEPDAVLLFDGRRREGADAVVAEVLGRPSSPLAALESSVIAGEDGWTARFTGPGGAPLPGPGGGLVALDFELRLSPAGLIREITVRPRHDEPDDLQPALRPGDAMPAFALPDVDGVQVPWHEPGHAAHVVVFTCNGCPWALGWHDRIQDVARDYAPRGVRLVQINANDPEASAADRVERSRERVAAGDFAGPYLLDPGQTAARRVGARHTPDIFVVDATGIVRYHGAADPDSERPELGARWLRDALDAVLAGGPVDLAETEPMGCTIKWTP